MFDFIVIGKGLMGVSAARYLSRVSPNVAVIGPDEPADKATHRGVFGAHYDEGRIARRLSDDKVWSVLNQRAMAQYPSLESESGFRFHYPTGGLFVARPGADDGYFQTLPDIGRRFDVAYEMLDHPAQQSTFPYLHFPATCRAVWEKPPAGYISPRAFIQAQLALARQQGATIVPEIAVSIETRADYVQVTTQSGAGYRAQKVLLAAGAFSNGFSLLQRKLALKLKTEIVVMAQILQAEADRLQQMPTVIYQIESPTLEDIYLLPPIRYPDGKIYVKMGANTIADHWVQNLDDTCAWYRFGDSQMMLPALREALNRIIPNLQATSWHTARCVVTYTAHGYPYIDAVEEGRVFVATGGNGRSAKCADAIGHIAANLVVNNSWRDDLEMGLFRLHFADETPAWTGRLPLAERR